MSKMSLYLCVIKIQTRLIVWKRKHKNTFDNLKLNKYHANTLTQASSYKILKPFAEQTTQIDAQVMKKIFQLLFVVVIMIKCFPARW